MVTGYFALPLHTAQETNNSNISKSADDSSFLTIVTDVQISHNAEEIITMAKFGAPLKNQYLSYSMDSSKIIYDHLNFRQVIQDSWQPCHYHGIILSTVCHDLWINH